MSNIIGGEFAVFPELINRNCNFQFAFDEYIYASGRGALYNILLNVKKNYPQIERILLPNYLCYSIVDTVIAAGFILDFYNIDWTFIPDIEQIVNLYTNQTGLMLINYFGITNLDPLITGLRKEVPDICIILDNVQALFDMRKTQKVNYSFTSLRKWLPVPDGAIVKTNEGGMLIPQEKNIFSQWKFAGAILKAYRFFPEITDEMYLDLLKRGEDFLEKSYDYKCSTISLSILGALDYNYIKKTRLKNARFLINSLKHIDSSILPWQTELITNNVVPMFVPIRSEKRTQIKKRLADNNIFCPIHWPPPPPIYMKVLTIFIKMSYP